MNCLKQHVGLGVTGGSVVDGWLNGLVNVNIIITSVTLKKGCPDICRNNIEGTKLGGCVNLVLI